MEVLLVGGKGSAARPAVEADLAFHAVFAGMFCREPLDAGNLVPRGRPSGSAAGRWAVWKTQRRGRGSTKILIFLEPKG
jgi:hypothetical protein